jgi:hypothetical protein
MILMDMALTLLFVFVWIAACWYMAEKAAAPIDANIHKNRKRIK